MDEIPRPAIVEELDVGPYSLRGSFLTGFPDFGLGVAVTAVLGERLSLEGGANTSLVATTWYGRIGPTFPLEAGPRHLFTLTPALGYRGLFTSIFEVARVGGPTATASIDWFHGRPKLAFDLQLTAGAYMLLVDRFQDYESAFWPDVRLSYGVAF